MVYEHFCSKPGCNYRAWNNKKIDPQSCPKCDSKVRHMSIDEDKLYEAKMLEVEIKEHQGYNNEEDLEKG